MKVLKYGDGHLRTTICEECKSELEYGTNDVDTIISDHEIHRDDEIIERWQKSYIICPVCQHHIELWTEKILEYIRKPIALTPAQPAKKKRWWQI